MGIGRTKDMKYYVDKNGCFICTSHYLDKDGYPKFKRNNTSYYMHRYVYEENFGEIPKGLIVRHMCDNTSCINPKHLILGTNKDNSEDMVMRKRSSTGVKNGQNKLSETEVIEIKNSDLSQMKLSKTYSVSQKTIWDIKNKFTWSWLE